MQGRRNPAPQGSAPKVDAPVAKEEPALVAETTEPAAVEPAPKVDAPVAKATHPQGWVKCLALQTCGVRGMPAYAGETFWLEPEGAQRLKAKGHLRIL